jgi:hypothetical protein
MVFGFGARRNTNNNVPGYAKFKINARRFVNQYYKTPNKTQTTNINASLVRNVHTFLNGISPKQAANAGAAAAGAANAGAPPAVQAGAAAGAAAAPGNNALAAGVNAALGARANGGTPNQAAAAGNAAAASAAGAPPPPPPLPPRPFKSPPPPQPKPAVQINPIANAAAKAAKQMKLQKINRLVGNLSNNTKRNSARALLQEMINSNANLNQVSKNKITAALKLPNAAPASGNLINMSGNSAPPPPPAGGPVPSNGPATMFGLEWANNANKRRNIYAKNMVSKIYYAKKNGSNTNYYRVINGASGKKIFDPNNKSVYLWNKNSMNFVKKVGGAGNNNLGLSGLVQQAASNVRSQSGSNRGSSVASGNLGNVSSSGENSNNNPKN